MNQRLKKIRNNFDLSQEAFGKRLGVTKASISRLESGINNITEQMLLSVCREFDINEEWLRTGNGSMFAELSKEELVAGLVAKKIKTGDPFVLNTLIALGKLGDEEWALLKKIVDDIASQYDKNELEENKKESN